MSGGSRHGKRTLKHTRVCYILRIFKDLVSQRYVKCARALSVLKHQCSINCD